MSLARKLKILHYPNANSIKFESREQFIGITTFLIDKYFNNWINIENKENLLTVNDGWEPVFLEFLSRNQVSSLSKDLSDMKNKEHILDLLSTLAIKSYYKENSEQIHETKYKCLQKMKLKQSTCSQEELTQAIFKLAQLFNIKVTDEKSYLKILKIIVRIAERKFDDLPNLVIKEKDNTTKTTTTTTTTTNNNNNNNSNDNSTSEIVNNNIYPLGFSDLGNDKMTTAATILRLLYVSDLREVQTKINQILEAVQSFTADPQTNFALGVVGR
ncbi:hypothetical protein DLAC_05621 [Tieghemostelium lacteum]|uniref:Uncharacterized protein n=1 Tax=Tieghemostelium lacteum TaxID=361077 RepID=A0A151ZGB8_TIELA|nr:hypothetical protein DLAC_05621 [Tieghemostelium lacteum]|eukprot:KYQ93016.1 hypothetical protein DLAC_05621 [Tieghemostelium lacteum]